MVEVEPPRRIIFLRGEVVPWEAIEAAISALVPPQREAVLLLLEEGLTHAQIANRLGVKRAAVTRRLLRARDTAPELLRIILSDPS